MSNNSHQAKVLYVFHVLNANRPLKPTTSTERGVELHSEFTIPSRRISTKNNIGKTSVKP